MTSHATQSSIQMSAPGVLGRAASGKGFSKILSAAEIRTLAESYSSAQVDTLVGGRVPYTGATSALDLGANALTCGAVEVSKNNGKNLRSISNATELFGIGPAYISGSYYDRTHITTNRFSYWSFSSPGSQLIFGEDASLPSTGSVSISASVSGGLGLGSSAGVSWYSNSSIPAGTADVVLARHSTGPSLNVRAAGGLRVLNLAGSSDAALTCGAITTSGNLAIRNGLTPMKAEIFGTISGTAWESLCLKATASAMQIGSTVGTGGGTNRPVQLGHFNSAGAFTSGLSVAANGNVTISSALSVPSIVTTTGVDAAAGGNGLRFGTNARIYSSVSNTIKFWNSAINGAPRLNLGGDTNAFAGIQGTGTTVNFVLADGTGASDIFCGDVTASGNFNLTALPTSDPGVAGRVWRDGTTLKISV